MPEDACSLSPESSRFSLNLLLNHNDIQELKCYHNYMARKRKPNILLTPICAVIMIVVLVVCAFPFMGLKEGSFFYSVLRPIRTVLDAHLNPLALSGYTAYGLIPLAVFCIANFVLALLGSGLIAFILRNIAYYGAYILTLAIRRGTGDDFRILSVLPQKMILVALIGGGSLVVGIGLNILLWKVRRKKAFKPIEEQVAAQDEVPSEQSRADEEPKSFSLSFREDEIPKQKKPSIPDYKRNPVEYRNSIDSLLDVKIPQFSTYPNYSLTASVSSVDRGNFNVAELEAKVRLEEQKRLEEEIQRKQAEEERKKREAEEQERLKKQAEENRKRIENLFKPRNLMKKLNEDAEAEKSFPSYASADISIVEPQESQFVEEPEDEEPVEAAPSYSYEPSYRSSYEPSSDIPVSQQIPPSQMMNMNPFASEPEAEPEPEPQVETTSVFKQASEQAEQDAQIAFRRRQAELERKHLEEMQELERRRQEAEEAARKAEELLEKTKAEMQRQQEQAKAKEEEEGISDEDLAANDAKTKDNGPDIDYVSGVAGLKSSINGTSYLLDGKKYKYEFPPESLLKHYPVSTKIYENPENDPDGQTIVETFRQFRIETSLVNVQHGPTFTLYELTLAKGIKVTSVLAYSENIAMDLSVEAVRILAPIPGKALIGVEVPNKQRDAIGFDVMMQALKAKYYKIPMVLGKNITGDSIVIDVAKTPHLLVAGTTGSGKSVCINGLICSVLYTKTPSDVRMILVDPKMVELSIYNGIPHLLTPVITEPKRALKAMTFAVSEMDRRMKLFSSLKVKKIEDYNQKIVDNKIAREKLPYIMIIIDEFADLMMAVGKELETSIKRITQLARFCGIHLVLATQRPSADVITGIIKSNIPTQIAFAVSNYTNSKIIIDQSGAEKLLGRGDMLYNNPESRQPMRIQGAFIDSEIEEIVSFVKTQGEPDYIDESYFEDDDEDEEEAEDASDNGTEDMFSKAWKIVTDRGEASASYLQRKLGIGDNRAANLIEQMEDAGYVGPARGSKPREILKMYGSD